LTSYAGDGNVDDDDGVGGVDCEAHLIIYQRPVHRNCFFLSFSSFFSLILTSLFILIYY
jgi:hypothetical protein